MRGKFTLFSYKYKRMSKLGTKEMGMDIYRVWLGKAWAQKIGYPPPYYKKVLCV
jgi:hypothetical protein